MCLRNAQVSWVTWIRVRAWGVHMESKEFIGFSVQPLVASGVKLGKICMDVYLHHQYSQCISLKWDVMSANVMNAVQKGQEHGRNA